MLVLGSDDQIANSAFAGQILRQSGTPFSATPLSGTYVGYQSGLGSSAGTSRSTLLILTASGSSLSGTQLRNDGDSFSSRALSGLTYSVASSGRMTVTGGSTPPIFYLVSANEAFSLNGDNGGGTDTVDTGFFQSQTGGAFSNSSANGAYAYGSTTTEESNAGINAGVATFTPATTSVSVVGDHNGSGSLSGNQTQSFTIPSIRRAWPRSRRFAQLAQPRQLAKRSSTSFLQQERSSWMPGRLIQRPRSRSSRQAASVLGPTKGRRNIRRSFVLLFRTFSTCRE